MYGRLSAAVAEMQAIRAGKAAPARAWEVAADGKGGFVRRQIAPARKAPWPPVILRKKPCRRGRNLACPRIPSPLCSA